jgi:hypothetical protein
MARTLSLSLFQLGFHQKVPIQVVLNQLQDFELFVIESQTAVVIYNSIYQFATFLQLFSYSAIAFNRFTAIVFPVSHYTVRRLLTRISSHHLLRGKKTGERDKLSHFLPDLVIWEEKSNPVEFPGRPSI